jgi:hypothetical protein
MPAPPAPMQQSLKHKNGKDLLCLAGSLVTTGAPCPAWAGQQHRPLTVMHIISKLLTHANILCMLSVHWCQVPAVRTNPSRNTSMMMSYLMQPGSQDQDRCRSAHQQFGQVRLCMHLAALQVWSSCDSQQHTHVSMSGFAV